jgi:outer membrane protein TolC
MRDSPQFLLTRPGLLANLAMAAIVCFGFGAAGQSSSGMGSAAAYGSSQNSAAGAFTGSVPSGPATTEVVHLNPGDAITQALRYTITSASTAAAQQSQVSTVPGLTIPVLTIDEAVALAVKGNRQVRSTALGVDAAQQETAAQRTSRWPQFETYVLGGEALRPISFTIPKAALGFYPATGPIPAKNSQVTTPQQFTALVFAQASQPLSQLWNIHLSLISSKIGEDLARESLRQQRQDTAQSVRDLYYQIAQTQTEIGNAEANEKYLVELAAETERNLAQQAALKGDSLSVRAKLSQQRYQLLNLRDTEQTQKENLNRLLGRDLSTPFSVEVQPMPTPQEIDLQAAHREAIEQRTEVREARLQAKKADTEVRQERAQYIPDVSATFTYVTLPNLSFAPQNVLQAGFLFKWDPFDWGQKRHKSESLRDSANQATLSEQDAEQQVILDVNAKFRGLAEARVLLDTTALSQEAEREKLRVAVNRYEQKAALLSDVLQQEGAVSAASSDYVNAVAAFWRAKASFDRSLGRE